MSCDGLLPYVPPIARYRREPLDDRQNALAYWDEAVAVMVGLDDALYDELVDDKSDTCSLAISINESNADRVRLFLEENGKTFELLHDGVRCGRVQFPELEEEGGSVAEHAGSMNPLADLAQTWFILAQNQIADGDLRAAASELIALGQMGHMICCGEGLVMHYLIGSAVMGTALAGIQLLVAGHEVPDGVLADLSAAVNRWIEDAGDVAQCLRVDLCSYALREIDRLSKAGGTEALVDQSLERHYANSPMLDSENEQPDGAFEDDGRLQWRRDKILYLLEGHPAPFDKIETARLVGQLSAGRILDLERPPWFDLVGLWGRVKRAYRRSRFASRCRLWPGQLRPSFPYEYLGPGDDARRGLAEVREHVTARQWAGMQPPTDEQLDAARRSIRVTPNALGVLTADALLAVNISSYESLRRQRLGATRAVIAGAVANVSP